MDSTVLGAIIGGGVIFIGQVINWQVQHHQRLTDRRDAQALRARNAVADVLKAGQRSVRACAALVEILGEYALDHVGDVDSSPAQSEYLEAIGQVERTITVALLEVVDLGLCRAMGVLWVDLATVKAEVDNACWRWKAEARGLNHDDRVRIGVALGSAKENLEMVRQRARAALLDPRTGARPIGRY